ncbi:tetratricopeptide repeat protein [Rhizobium sp. PAMB 3182]
MVTLELKSLKVLLVSLPLALCAAGGSAFAFDIPEADSASKPFDVFKLGFKAYQSGHKDEAVEAYRYAAEKGHTGSRWALASMYAYGDGVTEDDYEAFKIYSEIASEDVEPGSEDTGFFVSALMSLANYYHNGIPNSPVTVNLPMARQLYQAAATFGVAEAQFQLARMILAGEGGKVNVKLAKKWLNQARKKGHPGAMAVFGNLIFEEGQSVLGLAYMTAALDLSAPQDHGWVQEMQEQAFSVVSEDDRRNAVALAQKFEKTGATQ